MKALTGFLLVAMLAFGVYAISQQSRQTTKQPAVENNKKQTESEQQKSHEQKTNSNKPKPVLLIDTSGPAKILQYSVENEHKNTQKPPGGWRDVLKNPTSVFTGILAAFTIFLVLVGKRQLYISRETMMRQLKAYVFAHTMEIANVAGVPPPNNPVSAGPWVYRPSDGPISVMVIKNSGQTPAYDMVCRGNMTLREYPLVSTLPQATADFYPISKSPIPPGGLTHQTLVMKRPLKPEEIEGLKNRSLGIYIHGKITYADAFGKKRFTNFQYFYNSEAGIVGKETCVIACTEGNESN